MIRFALVLAATGAALTPPPPTANAVTHAAIDVPSERAQQVIVQSRMFPPGVESGWHVHPGTEIAYVIGGEMELQTAEGRLILEPGDSFTMPRGTAHNGINNGSANAEIVLTLVVDKGVPAREMVPAPRES